MDEQQTREMEADPGAAGGEETDEESVDLSPASLESVFKERRQQIGEDRETFLTVLQVPEKRMALVGRYRRLTHDDLDKIAKRVMRSKHPQAGFMAQVDTIATALIEMYIEMPDGKRVPLADVIPGETNPVRYDDRLGAFLGFDPEGSARKAVLATFNNDLAITPHHNELSAWMQTGYKFEEEDFNESLDEM